MSIALVASPSDPNPRVLDWLERVFPVRFKRSAALDPRQVDGALVLDPDLLTDASAEVPRLLVAARVAGRGETARVTFSDDKRVARPLRGRTITESASGDESRFPPPAVGGLLAHTDAKPLWWQAGDGRERLYCSVYPLAEIGEQDTLRDHLRAGRFMGLVPLIHFLGEILGEQGWRLPAPRASFVIDDPNLHWPSYGYLRYGELVRHASQHGYHLGLAMVPLDGWRVDRRAASLVSENPSALSLLVHGNNHVARELGRLQSNCAEPSMAQALRRIAAFERRSGLQVNRVMAPPHGACSEPALRAMYKLGFDAACVSRPYPWRDGQPAPTALAGWHPAELVAGGLPVLPRHPLSAPRDDLAFRALLGQPLILYGHHDDFSDGLDLLAEACADINSLADNVQWSALGPLTGGGYATRRVGRTMFVRMYARHIAIEIPDGVENLRIQAQEPLGGAGWHQVSHLGGVADMRFEEELGISGPLPIDGSRRIELTLVADRPLSPSDVVSPHFQAWPLVRRLLVEGRDRARPLLG